MQAAEGLTEAAGAFVENQDDAVLVAETTDVLQITFGRAEVTADFHLHGSEVGGVADNLLNLLEIVVVERDGRAAQALGDTGRRNAGQQMTGQGIIFTQVHGHIPVVPAVVTADGDLILSRIGTGNTNAHGVGFTASAGIAHAAGPGIHLNQALGQIHFFGAVQGGEVSVADYFHHGFIHFFAGIAQRIGAHTHQTAVNVFTAVQVPYMAALGFAVIGRPVFRQQLLRTFGKEAGSTRNKGFGLLVKLLSFSHIYLIFLSFLRDLS